MGSYSNSEKTKQSLILAAGQLFVENGIDSVSVRAIAELAKENPGSIHYHFGGKDGLVLAVVRYVMKDWGDKQFKFCFEQNRDLLETSEGQVELISKLIHLHFDLMFRQGKPAWCTQLVYRIFVTPGEPLQVLLEGLVKPHHRFWLHFFGLLRPDFSVERRSLLFTTLMGQIAHFSNARPVILELYNMDDYSDDFIDAIEEQVISNIACSLGLPQSDFTKQPHLTVQI
jgi:TetR/AcrR family transcriptional regulator, regulator of cefoperazone and chloramphenicol sensitivity